jgi:cyclopropane fatty-acyl-phospholipid synthase-like methyltransferase
MQDYISPLNTDYVFKYDDNPRTELIDLITEPPHRVLEIGCGAGATGLALKQKFQDIEYVGVEPDEGAAKIAQTRLDRVIFSDIEKVQWDTIGLHKEYFDLIICADVLEHIYDPWKTLFALRNNIAPDGKILASIPNIQHISIINNLLNDHWTYSKYGLLDATHIRFFTLSEITKMFSGTGYKMIQCSHTTQPEIESVKKWPTDLDFGKFVLKNVTRDEASKFFVFQYFIIAQKISS